MSSSRKRLTWAVALGVAVTGLAAPTASANPAGTGLVISEVFGGGGNTGATLKNDFIELYNPTDAAISVSGMSVQYRSASGSGTGVTPLTGSVPAKSHYLVQEAAGSGGTVDLPTPDATGSLAMSGTSGVVFLAQGTTALTVAGDVTASPVAGVLDLVGYGSATVRETAATGVTLSSTTSASRAASGKDSDDNSADFATGAPTPTASGTTTDPGTPPAPVEKSIPEIQGTGLESPVKGSRVVTTGVVTAAYPSGGLNGFFLQTPGSGSAGLDLATRTASDGVFVYQESAARPVTVTPGDHVRVTGTVAEYAGMTQVSVAAASDIVEQTAPAAPVVATTTTAWPRTTAERELLEGMLYTPTGDFTVTNTYNTNQYGEVGLAQGDKPLIQPTQVADAQDTAAIKAVEADNAARAIQLDDASSVNFSSASSSALTPAYISNDEPVRVGAGVTFTEPVIFAEGGSSSAPTYRFQPLAPVVGPDNVASPAEFENTRTPAPDETRIDPAGKADVKVASFNVLNYFTTLGDADDDNVGDGGCLAYKDRDGDGTNVSGGCDQRGAWDPADFERQQTKIVKAINALDADVVGLMEIENSAKLGESADEATNSLVAALNAEAGGDVWAANPSSTELPPVTEMDVISNAIIYRTASVKRVGDARALGELSGAGEAFDNAREPIAQAFAPVKGGEPFLVVVNHLKSKGSGVDDGTGQGNANPDRIAQAEALRDWVPGVQSETGVEAVLLVGDFNAYALEDPLQVLYAAGYRNVEQEFGNDEYSYSFSGLSGSLDHVLANDAAMQAATGADIWNINSGEALPLEYSRYNYHGTDFHEPTPYRSSDHDPVVLGLDVAADPVVKSPSTTYATVIQRKILQGRTRPVLVVRVSSDDAVPTGQVQVQVSEQDTRTVSLRRGRAIVVLGKFRQPGVKEVTVTYLGDASTAGSETSFTLRVVRK